MRIPTNWEINLTKYTILGPEPVILLLHGTQNSHGFSALSYWRNQNERLPLTPSSFPSRNGKCFAVEIGMSPNSVSGFKGNMLDNR